MTKRGRAAEAALVARITSCFNALVVQHQKRLDSIAMDRALYYLDHYNSTVFKYGAPKEGEERWVDTQPKDVVDIATAILTGGKPRVHAFALKMTAKKERAASDIETFLLAILAHNERRWGEPIFRLAVQDALQVGQAVVFCGWDSDFEGEDEAGYDDLPIVVRYVRPEFFFWVPGGKRAYSIQMEALYRRADVVENEWGKPVYKRVVEGDEEKRIPTAATDLVLYVDYWWLAGKEVHHAVIAGDTLLQGDTIMPNYPDLPFCEIVGFRTSASEPHRRCVSLLYALRHQTIQKERMVNRLLQAIKQAGDPQLIAPEGTQVEKRPGGIMYYDPSGKAGADAIRWLTSPGAPRDIYEALAIFERKAQHASLGEPSYGSGGSGAGGSGVAQQVSLGADQVRLGIPRDDIGLGWSRVFNVAAGLAANYAKDKKLRALVPGPEREVMEVKGQELDGWMFEVTVQAQTQEMLNRALVVAGNARQSNVSVSDRWLLENLVGIEQPDRVIEERLIEQLMADPTMRQAAFIMAVKKLGVEPQELMAALRGEEVQTVKGPPLAPVPQMPPGVVYPPTAAVPPGAMGQMLPQETGLPRGGVQGLAPEQQGALKVT